MLTVFRKNDTRTTLQFITISVWSEIVSLLQALKVNHGRYLLFLLKIHHLQTDEGVTSLRNTVKNEMKLWNVLFDSLSN